MMNLEEISLEKFWWNVRKSSF